MQTRSDENTCAIHLDNFYTQPRGLKNITYNLVDCLHYAVTQFHFKKKKKHLL